MSIKTALTTAIAFMAAITLMMVACSKEQPVRNFVLPKGDIEQGQEVFIAFNCYRCHDIAGVDLPERTNEPPFVVQLGGKVMQVKDYGELLTAVVYPNHVISPNYKTKLEQVGRNPEESPMPYFGDIMTVTELTDLVEFLHAQYSRLLPNNYQGHYMYR